mgnify:CR=1 FL=1
MKFNFWEKGKLFYLNGIGVKTSVGIRYGQVNVSSSNKSIEAPLKSLIESHLNGSMTVASLENVLVSLSDAQVKREVGLSGRPGRKVNIDDIDLPASIGSHFEEKRRHHHPLFSHAEALDPSTIKFRSRDTADNIQIIVDHREPNGLVSALRESCIPSDNIIVGSQDVDVRIVSMDSLDELIIERKTVADLNQSVQSNHAHDQSERYYDYMLEKAEAGVHVRVLWIIEGDPVTGTLPNQALNGLPQLDGWNNYMMMINDQFFHYTYCTRHTAYSIIKMAQGFFERTLAQRVSVGKTARIKAQRRETRDSGATRSGMNLKSQLMFLDGMTTNVADELSKLNKSFREILAMSTQELLEIKGIGAKRADRLFDAFNMK